MLPSPLLSRFWISLDKGLEDAPVFPQGDFRSPHRGQSELLEPMDLLLKISVDLLHLLVLASADENVMERSVQG